MMRTFFYFLTFLLLPLIALAGEAYSNFVPLVGIPYVETDTESRTLGEYVNALYIAAISIAAVLAVLRIIYAGVQYMLTDVVTQKGAAKKTIRNALIGLILIVAAFLILNTINPQLTSLNSLDQLQGLNLDLRRPEPEPDSPYTGPESCPDPTTQRLVQDAPNEEGEIVRRCVDIEDDTIPDERNTDLEEGEIIRNEIVPIPCIPNAPGGSCQLTNHTDNTNGINQAEAECSSRSNGRGEFTPTSITQGICSWTEFSE